MPCALLWLRESERERERKKRTHHYKAIPKEPWCGSRRMRWWWRRRWGDEEKARVSHCCSTNKYAQCFIVAKSIVRVKFMYRLCIHEVCERMFCCFPNHFVILFVLCCFFPPHCFRLHARACVCFFILFFRLILFS